jgi:hypothetical protein
VEEVELGGARYSIQNREAFEKWQQKTKFKEKPETLVRKGVLAPITSLSPDNLAYPATKPLREERVLKEAMPVAQEGQKPRGIVPTAEIWGKTPMEIDEEWGKASEYVETHQNRLDTQIKEAKGKLNALKGDRSKQGTLQRKTLTDQVALLKEDRERPKGEYEGRFIEASEALGEEARKRAAARGLPEEDMDEFIEEFQMESSTERPYIEYNYKKTVDQIFDEVLRDYLEKPTAEEIAPAPEKGAPPSKMDETDAAVLRGIFEKQQTIERESLLGSAFSEGIDNLGEDEQNLLFKSLFTNYRPENQARYVEGWREIAPTPTPEVKAGVEAPEIKTELPPGVKTYEQRLAYDEGLAGRKFPERILETKETRSAYDAGLAGRTSKEEELRPVKVTPGKPEAGRPSLAASLETIPEDIEIEREGVREKTGKVFRFKQNAREALIESESNIDRFNKLLDCVRT